tara:strand:+ start:1339 stop:1716 length:378 start_codon:yes stop_codon:yes gene_type:complete
LQAVLHDFASLSLLQLLVLEQSEVEQQPPMQFMVEQELKKVPKLKTKTNDKIYFLIISPYFLLQDLPSATVLVLQHDVLESQLLIQHTALITPQVNTATKTTFKANSMPSFQQFQLSHFIYHSFI